MGFVEILRIRVIYISCSFTVRLCIVKKTVLSNLFIDYMSANAFVEIDKLVLEFIWKGSYEYSH